MALKVKSFAQIAEASSSLQGAATAYQTALEQVRTLVNETESMWIGDDADAYRKKIREAIDPEKPLDKVGKEIQSHSKTLSDTSAILSKVSANIKTAMS